MLTSLLLTGFPSSGGRDLFAGTNYCKNGRSSYGVDHLHDTSLFSETLLMLLVRSPLEGSKFTCEHQTCQLTAKITKYSAIYTNYSFIKLHHFKLRIFKSIYGGLLTTWQFIRQILCHSIVTILVRAWHLAVTFCGGEPDENSKALCDVPRYEWKQNQISWRWMQAVLQWRPKKHDFEMCEKPSG